MSALTQEMKVANCVCCTLASNMRPCHDPKSPPCPFMVGLPVRQLIHWQLDKSVDEQTVLATVQETYHRFPGVANAYQKYVEGIPAYISQG